MEKDTDFGSSSERELGADQGSSSEERREPCDNTFILEECPCSRRPKDNPLNRAYIKNSGIDKFNSIYQRAISYLEEYKSRYSGQGSNSELRADIKDSEISLQNREEPKTEREQRHESLVLKRRGSVLSASSAVKIYHPSTLEEIGDRTALDITDQPHRFTRDQIDKIKQGIDPVGTTACYANQRQVIVEAILRELGLPLTNRSRVMTFITNTNGGLNSETELVRGSSNYRSLKQTDYFLIQAFLNYLGLDIRQIFDTNISSGTPDILQTLFTHPLVIEKLIIDKENTWPIIQTLSGIRPRTPQNIGLVLEGLIGWDAYLADDEKPHLNPINPVFVEYMKRIGETMRFLHEIDQCQVEKYIEDCVDDIEKRNDMFSFLSNNPTKVLPFILTEKGEIKSDGFNNDVVHWANLKYKEKICVGPLSNGKCYLMPIYSIRTAWGQSGSHTFYYSYTSNHVIELELREMLDYMREIPCIPLINKDKMKGLFTHMFLNPASMRHSIGDLDDSARWLDENIDKLKWRNLTMEGVSISDRIKECLSGEFIPGLNIDQERASSGQASSRKSSFKKGGKTNKRKNKRSKRRSNKRKGRKNLTKRSNKRK
jgi:hypothetical protein